MLIETVHSVISGDALLLFLQLAGALAIDTEKCGPKGGDAIHP